MAAFGYPDTFLPSGTRAFALFTFHTQSDSRVEGEYRKKPPRHWTEWRSLSIIVANPPFIVGKIASIEVSAGHDWLQGLLCNERQSIQQLYNVHFPAVRKYILDNSGTLDDAQDIFQEAFLVLWLRVKEGRYEAGTNADPGGFLFQVAKHKWLDVLRSANHRHMRVLRDEEMSGLVADTAGPGTEDQLVRLRSVYARLDAKCRQVLDLFYFERKDLATIARTLSVEEESIRTIKYRCMMKLRASRKMIKGDNHREA